MNNYQFRTNWLGHLVLQRRFMYNRFYSDKSFVWHDAGVEDLKDYYEQLHKISNPCVSPEFDRLRAVANLSKNAGPT